MQYIVQNSWPAVACGNMFVCCLATVQPQSSSKNIFKKLWVDPDK